MKITYIMYNIQDYSVLYNNTVPQVICEGLTFYSHVESTRMAAFH